MSRSPIAALGLLLGLLLLLTIARRLPGGFRGQHQRLELQTRLQRVTLAQVARCPGPRLPIRSVVFRSLAARSLDERSPRIDRPRQHEAQDRVVDRRALGDLLPDSYPGDLLVWRLGVVIDAQCAQGVVVDLEDARLRGSAREAPLDPERRTNLSIGVSIGHVGREVARGYVPVRLDRVAGHLTGTDVVDRVDTGFRNLAVPGAERSTDEINPDPAR